MYVNRTDEVLVLASPHQAGAFTKQLLLDLLRTRQPLEVGAIAAAVRHATATHLKEMRRLLTTAEQNLDDDDVLNKVNMEFHRQISIASGNRVMLQTLDVLRELFTAEQRLILAIVASRERDHKEHLGILDALERRDAALAVERMRDHIEGVVKVVQKWNPEDHPVDGG